MNGQNLEYKENLDWSKADCVRVDLPKIDCQIVKEQS